MIAIRKGKWNSIQEAICGEYKTEIRNDRRCENCNGGTKLTIARRIMETSQNILLQYIGWRNDAHDWIGVEIEQSGKFAVMLPGGGPNV